MSLCDKSESVVPSANPSADNFPILSARLHIRNEIERIMAKN